MRNILFLLVALLIAMPVRSQYFVLTEDGLKPSKDPSLNFVVIDKEGKSKEDLFNQVKSFITAYYASPKDVMSEYENDMITLNAISEGDVQCKKGLVMLPFETNYTIVFMFKDGKIRVNSPSINSMLAESTTIGGDIGDSYQLAFTKNDNIYSGMERIVVFKGKGKTTKGAKESIESFFNSLIDKIVNYEEKSDDW